MDNLIIAFKLTDLFEGFGCVFLSVLCFLNDGFLVILECRLHIIVIGCSDIDHDVVESYLEVVGPVS